MFGHPPVYLDAPHVWILPCMLGIPMFGCPLNMCGHSHMFGYPFMFGWLTYIHNTKKAYFVTLRECPYAPIHLDAPCMFGCPSICLDAPHMFEHPAVYLGDVWMPPVHTQHIESMLCYTKGVSICPIHLDAPIYVDAPCMFGCPICLDGPLYV